MKFLSLFSGIGGFDLAFQRAGMECVGMCEIDKFARAVLQRHFPSVTLYDDVRKIGKNTHERESIDIVCGGFPCQDVSVAGRRAGLAGERSGLWFEFARIIDELEPRWTIIENVPGLLFSNKGRDFASIVQWLAKRGYGVCWRVLDAQYFGVPQRRRRVFIVGSFGNERAAEILFERDGSTWNIAPRGKRRDKNSRELAKCLTAREGQHRKIDQDNYIVLAGSQVPAIFWQSHNNSIRILDISSTISAYWGTGGNNVPFIGVRRFIPLECERLQGFPDNWTAGQSDTQRYRQLGNAIAVPVAEWIGTRIMGVIAK